MTSRKKLVLWNILHVDDDEEDRQLIAAMLQDAKGQRITIEGADSLEDGRRMLTTNRYHAVLVDYDLHTGTGIELIREFVTRGYEAPFILLTGRGSYDVDVEAMHAGATLYLTKNEINPLLLERSIRYAIERKQAEQGLLERDHKLTVALDAAELGTWVYSFDDHRLEMDERARQMYRANSAVESHDWIVEQILHPEDVPAMWAALSRAMDPAGNGRYQVEYRILQPDGSTAWLNAWGRVQFEGEGAKRKPVRLVGASRDITWEKQARLDLEQSNLALRESESRFRDLSNNISQMAWIMDPDGWVTWYNQRWLDYTGATLEEMQGWGWQKIHHPDHLVRVLSSKRRCLESGKVWEETFPLRGKDGQYRWFLTRAVPIRDETGKITRWFGTNTDITEQREMEATLRASAAPRRGPKQGREKIEGEGAGMPLLERSDMLRQTDERFEKFFKLNPAGLAITQIADGRYLYVNESFCQLLGYRPEEMIGRSVFELGVFTEPADREVLLDRLRTEGSVRNHALTLRTKSGGTRRLLFSGDFIEMQDQTLLLSAYVDITEKRQVEDELRTISDSLREANDRLQSSDEQFRRLADAMPHLVWTARPDGLVDYCNRRLALYTGIEWVSENQLDLLAGLHPKDFQPTMEIWNDALRTGKVYQIEHRMRMADGSYRWHLSRGVPAYNDQGRLTKWYGTTTDIHDFRQIKKTLRQREQRLRRLFESNLIGIVAREPSGRVLEANDAYLDMIGYSCEEVEAGEVHITDITPPEYYPLDEFYSNQVLIDGFCKPFEKEYIRKDGRHVPVLVGYSLFEAEEPEFIGYVLDLSELKQTRAELEVYTEKLKRSNEELENFAFIASHDLQEPLRKILMFGDTLRRQLNGQINKDADEYLSRMQNAAVRMQAMINGLLDLSRVNTRGTQFERVDLTEVAGEVVSDLEPRIRNTGGKVVVGKLPVVDGDVFQLRRLFQNLISNGLKYHKPDVPPEVFVISDPAEAENTRSARIMVKDNGIGFEQKHAEDIFQPFVRLHGHSRYEGTGIGLAICRRIVERHGGTIRAESRMSVGTTFYIHLPVRRGSEE